MFDKRRTGARLQKQLEPPTTFGSELSTTDNGRRAAQRVRGDQHETNTSEKRQRRQPAANTRQRRRAVRPVERADEAGRARESLEVFFEQARVHPLLTAAEEIELTKRIERGDLTAKERMINSNLRLVVSQARRYQGLGLEMGDLVQEGMLGLIRAVEKFDWRKGFKFSTYGTLWIRQAIQRGLQNTGRTIRVPVHVSQQQTKLRRLETELATKLSREPTDDELAEVAKFPVEEVRELRELSRNLASLDQSIDDEGETSLGELLASDRPGPPEELADAELSQQLGAVVDQLPESERNVIRLRFGLTGEGVRTLKQAGTELGISAERARQLEEQGLRRLARSPELAALREAA